ncbi:MAG: DUF4412 domain-containing protein [Acidobacteriaceae bacterium]
MKKRLAVSVVPILLFGLSAMAQVAPAQFSADLLMHSQRGDMTGKMFFAGKKMRTDMETPGGAMRNITDVEKKQVVMVMPERKMYMVVDLSHPSPMARGQRTPEIQQFDPANPCSNRPGMTCKKVGSETVNGRDCDKWEFSKNGQVTETEWIDKKLHIAVKSQHEDGSTWELKNIKEGPQPDSLFEIPAGYQKLDMGGMMGGIERPH